MLGDGGATGLHQGIADRLPREEPVDGLQAAQTEQQNNGYGQQELNRTLATLGVVTLHEAAVCCLMKGLSIVETACECRQRLLHFGVPVQPASTPGTRFRVSVQWPNTALISFEISMQGLGTAVVQVLQEQPGTIDRVKLVGLSAEVAGNGHLLAF